jgi:hypothetical protein
MKERNKKITVNDLKGVSRNPAIRDNVLHSETYSTSTKEYDLTNETATWKVIFSQQVNKSPSSYDTRRFFNAFTTARCLTLS